MRPGHRTALSAPPAARRRAARSGVLALILLSLLLMHGGPATAGGCHGSMTAPAPMGHTIAAGDHTAEHQHHLDAARPAADMGGTVCIATLARNGGVLPTPVVVAVLPPAVPPLAGPAWTTCDGCRRRSTGGRDLLHQICIART